MQCTAHVTIAFSRYLTMDHFKSLMQNKNCIAYLYIAEI